MYAELYQEAQALAPTLVQWRRDLHQMPEIGLDLPQTAAYVAHQLAALGIDFERKAGGSCIAATLGQGDRCLLLRADMDALPMREESGLDFAAINGNMHACGHDLHATALLGAAALLKRHEAELGATIKLLFQPGEETFSGAKACIGDGVLENPHVDAAFATHVISNVPVGTLCYGHTPNASVYGFKLTITGKGTHGAMPEGGIDPINVGVHIYLALENLIARECAPSQEVSLTIGQFAAGSAANIIPETAVLQGTLRTFEGDLRTRLIRRISEVSDRLAAAFGARVDLEVLSDSPALVCDEAQNAAFAAALAQLSPDLTIREGLHTTASEDFAFYAQHVPATFVAIGAQADDGPVYAQHNPKVCFNERALAIGCATYAAAALSWK
ncbi:MAG: M20 family metallopeptidase [Peptococcaceae bacterium]|nr:M20 family metallopeptidase [Peptococcaceae bacterium]